MKLFLVTLLFATLCNGFMWSSRMHEWEEFWLPYSDKGEKIICTVELCPCVPNVNGYKCQNNGSIEDKHEFIWFDGNINGDTQYLKWNYPIPFNREVGGYINMTLQFDSWKNSDQNISLNLFFQSQLIQVWNQDNKYSVPTTISIPLNTQYVSDLNIVFVYTSDKSTVLHTTNIYLYDFTISLSP